MPCRQPEGVGRGHEDGVCPGRIGWCQFGKPRELPNINNRKTYEAGVVELPTWRIGRIFTNSKDRGQGVAKVAVAGALEEIARLGGGVVEAYPEQTEDLPPQRGAYLHTGAEALYASFGFTRVRKIAKWRWVMQVTVWVAVLRLNATQPSRSPVSAVPSPPIFMPGPAMRHRLRWRSTKTAPQTATDCSRRTRRDRRVLEGVEPTARQVAPFVQGPRSASGTTATPSGRR